MSRRAVVIDNGAGKVKIGVAGAPEGPKVFGNYVVKSNKEKKRFVGTDELAKVKSALSYQRPFDRGYLLNWELEKEIWDAGLGRENPAECDLILTEPLFNPESLRKSQWEIVFEDFGFAGLFACSAPFLSMTGERLRRPDSVFAQCPACVVLDSGYSFSHSVPFFDNQRVNYAVKRVNVGGKGLTNYLKEIVSYRQYNMMEETWLINMIRERYCYVSLDFLRDLETTKLRGAANTIALDYVLPDYDENLTGYVKEPAKDKPSEPQAMEVAAAGLQSNDGGGDAAAAQQPAAPAAQLQPPEQILKLNNERICVPEALFHPSDIGINQAGVAEAVVQSIADCPPPLRAPMYANVLVTGGNALIPNFVKRLQRELRSMAPADCQLNIIVPDDPVLAAWNGGSLLAQQATFSRMVMPKQVYEECGASYCSRRFFN